MVVDRNSLSQTYANKSDEELLLLHKAGTLTELAYEVLEGELSRRGLQIPARTEIDLDERTKPKSRVAYIVGAVILVLSVNVITQMVVHPNREERRKLAVENIMESSRISAIQRFINGEELGNVEFVLIIPDIEASLNEGLPVMVDDVTRWDSFSVSEGQAVYKFTALNWSPPGSGDPASLGATLREKHKNHVCGDRGSWLFMKNDFKLVYSWHENDGSQIMSISYNKNDCVLSLKDGR